MKYWFLISAYLLCKSAVAQEILVDKIIARVDNYIILKSDIEATYLQMQASHQKVPENARCEILKSMIMSKMLMAKSEIDSIKVSDKEIENELDRRMAYFIAQAGDESKLEKTLGKTISQLKDELREQVKEQMIVREVQKEITKNIKVTPAQVKKFYQKIPPDSLPFLAAEVEVGQIVKIPQVSAEEKSNIRAFLLSLKYAIERGEMTFSEAARKYSEDPGSAQSGGELGWRSRGELVPEFEAVAMKIKPGEIADPVESEFGFHLIQLLNRKGNRFQARHILIRPKSSLEDIKVAARFLDSLRTKILQDSITFRAAAKQFSDDKTTKGNAGFFKDVNTGSQKIPMDEIEDPTIFFVLDTMKVGSISPVLRFRTEDGKEAVRILYYKAYYPPHYANLTDDYQKIALIAENEEKQAALDRWLQKAQKDVYIYIDSDYDKCNILQKM
ncbi:MAG: peptidylprolyl isomerase [Cytophagales bacterium]|nr:peptidylprolyl isomerase [Cytophagales bacterium]MDW8383746.1 peptidylprolyl isomerase [Flammeovirgaceae bacterium]